MTYKITFEVDDETVTKILITVITILLALYAARRFCDAMFKALGTPNIMYRCRPV